MGWMAEFRSFAMKGSVLDMAVGIIIGTAFHKIVSSLVADVVMPPLGLLVGGVDFSELAFVLKTPVAGSAAVTVKYGRFIQSVVDFAIIAFSVFVAVRLINALRQRQVAQPSRQEQLLTEIRDLLRQRQE